MLPVPQTSLGAQKVEMVEEVCPVERRMARRSELLAKERLQAVWKVRSANVVCQSDLLYYRERYQYLRTVHWQQQVLQHPLHLHH